MTCEQLDAELVGYHFATLEPEPRRAMEAHLVGCARCVAAFVALKRDIELAEGDARPSDAARARLRAAVRAELLGPERRAPRRWERPFAFAFAAAALLAAVVAVRGITLAPVKPPSLERLAVPAAGH